MSGLHRIDSHHHHHHHHHGQEGHGHHHAHHAPHGQEGHGHHHAHHAHEGHEPMVAVAPLVRSRRAFLGDLGKGTMAMAVLSPVVLAACSSNSSEAADPTAATSSGGSEESTSDAAEGDSAASDLVWARSNLGFVSAYVLARGNSAAIVDTGVAGSAEAIGATLGDLGLNYNDVAHVLLTHHHSDHTGSIGAVLEMAVNATAYAGEADVPSISAEVTGLAGGEEIFGLEMVPTPGHTLGHMAAIDHQAGLFIAGDAIFTEGGQAIEGPERFFMSVAESRRSIAAVAALSFNTMLVAHGEPIEGGADAAVAALAASFG